MAKIKATQIFKGMMFLILLGGLSGCAQNGSDSPSGSSSLASSGPEGSDSACVLTGSSLPASTLQIFTELCTLTNQERAAQGLEPLTLSLAVTNNAQAHASDMVTRNFFSHVNPDGLDPFQRLARDGVSYGAAGENIAAGQNSAGSVMSAWMNSSGHRANILRTSFKKLGLGYDSGRWVQVFTD